MYDPRLFFLCLLMTAAALCMPRYVIRKRKRHISPDLFFNKLKWKLQTGEMSGFSTFRVDVYEFRFCPVLSEEISQQFVEFAETLDMTQVRSVMILFVWLYQHRIKFRLVFCWNKELPAGYNLKNILMPRKVRKTLYKCGHDDLMACPLEYLKKRIYGKETR